MELNFGHANRQGRTNRTTECATTAEIVLPRIKAQYPNPNDASHKTMTEPSNKLPIPRVDRKRKRRSLASRARGTPAIAEIRTPKQPKISSVDNGGVLKNAAKGLAMATPTRRQRLPIITLTALN